MMTVYDFCELCTDDSANVTIYDMNQDVEQEVFSGTMRDAMYSDYDSCMVWSFDFCNGELVLNIETEEEE